MGNNFASNLTQYDPDGEYASAGSPLDPEEQLKPRVVASKWAAWPAEQETANSPQPSAPAATPSAPLEADYKGLSQRQQQQANANLDAADQARQTPEPTSTPELDALRKKIDAESAPTQLRENRPAGDAGVGTGELLSQYKPGFFGRIGNRLKAGIESGAEGKSIFAGLANPEKYSGAGYAGNKAYQQAEADRKATLAYDEGQLPGKSEALKAALERRRSLISGNETGAKNRIDLLGKLNETPEAKGVAAGSEQTAKDAAMFADRQQRWPTVANMVPKAQRDAAQVHYLLTGEMPKPGEQWHATAQEIFVARGVALKEKEKGGPLTSEEYMGVVRDASGRAGGGGQNEDIAQSLWARAGGELEKFRAGFIQNPTTGRWRNNDTNKSLTNEEYVNAADQIRKSYNVKLSKMGYEIKPDGQLASTRAAGADASATAGTAVPSAPAAAAAEPGIPISVARTFPVNKGKTDRQIIEHAASLGHTVIP